MMGKKIACWITILLLVAACADAPAPTPEPTDEPVPTAEPTEAATETPVEEEAPAEPTEAPPEKPTETPAETESDDPIYLAIIWHQHQPVYYKNPDTDSYVRPWVRVHATKDYVDMAATLGEYENVKATFNLTPSLLRQIEDLAAGATDEYWRLADIPAEDLTAEQQQFIRDRFFDINPEIIGRFDRYQELVALRDSGDEWTTADYRDLQVLFNLAWTDPDWLAEEPLSALVDKGRDFAESDKEIVFAEHQRLIEEVIPIHKQLQDAGQIEVTMTPFAHPILPLLVDTNAARVALPDVDLPPRFIFGQDAQAQVERGVEMYARLFERAPRGMWPAEGSVSQQIVSMVATNGIQWMATDEGVLANSLGRDAFTRDSTDLVQEADTLYRPYYVEGARGGPVAVVFRDVVISDKVGFTYSGMDGDAAAQDFVDRIHAIRDELQRQEAEGPHLVSVILDGENAWEFYENDGKAFLHGLYERLSTDENIVTVTPTEFLEMAPDQPQIDELWAGSWINHDFATWIGEPEENDAWTLLKETREMVQKYENGTREPPSEEALAEAMELMYIAEGSDWFWWYGSDQNSGNDDTFDQQFRDTLKRIYDTLGAEQPAVLDVPIIPLQAASQDQAATGLLTPEIDGRIEEDEWADAGVYSASGGVMQAADTAVESIAYGFDGDNLYINAVLGGDNAAVNDTLDLYLNVAGTGENNSFSGDTWLGFAANRWLKIALTPDGVETLTFREALGGEEWRLVPEAEAVNNGDNTATVLFADETAIQVARQGTDVEIAIPVSQLGPVAVGDFLGMRLLYNERPSADEAIPVAQMPTSGPASLAVPDLGNLTLVVDISDPINDDHGPGNYTYPQDGVFSGGNFDITNFQAGYDEESIIFKFDMRGPVENHWDSPNGLSGLTLDVYIDADGDGEGGTGLLPGRNLALADGFAWDYAIHAEGWTSAVYTPGEEVVRVAEASEFTVLADAGQRRITIRIPKSLLGDNPDEWQFAGMVMGQEGFPSGGVLRIRDVAPTAEQWRFGGAPQNATNHTRIIDLVWPDEGTQEQWLSDFEPTDTAQTDLTADDYARIEMFPATDE